MKEFEGFDYKDCEIAGDECVLITPKRNFGVVWDEENKYYRSVIIRKEDGLVISRGFNKFTNFHETPAFEPWDESWPVEARHKMDGSLLIVSVFKGVAILRTRGTTDARNLPNGHEIEVLRKKYPLFFDELEDEGWMRVSYLFEWTTPTNVIVIREHEEPTLTLLGVVDNETGKYWHQSTVDGQAKAFGFERPIKYVYQSVAQCISDVSAWQGSEGVILYSPDGQTMKKIKAEEYLRLHRLKSNVNSVAALVGLYVDSGMSADKQVFYDFIRLTTDYEIAEQSKDTIGRIVDSHKTISEEKASVRKFVSKFTDMSRKELAFEIERVYKDWRKGYAFTFLDGKDLDVKKMADLLEKKTKEQCLVQTSTLVS